MRIQSLRRRTKTSKFVLVKNLTMFMHEAKSLEYLEHNVSYQRLREVPIPVTKVLLEKVLKVESHINKSLDIVHMYENYK